MASPPPSQRFLDRRFLFVTGKGGVGKTTVSAALALAFARRGKRVLVAMCDACERLSSLLGTPTIEHDIARVSEGVWATRIDPQLAMEEYGHLVLKVKAVSRMVFDNRYTKSFFRAVPGMLEWAMLGKAWFHTTERDDAGRPRFDVVLFDAPATGHGLDMLRVPKVILDIVPPGVLRRDAERAWEMFRDPRQSGVVVVSQAEAMIATETLELHRALVGELGLPVACLVVNAMLPRLFSDDERGQLGSQADLLEPGGLAALEPEAAAHTPGLAELSVAARRAVREQMQADNLERLAEEISAPRYELPFLLEGAGDREAIEKLVGRL